VQLSLPLSPFSLPLSLRSHTNVVQVPEMVTLLRKGVDLNRVVPPAVLDLILTLGAPHRVSRSDNIN